MKQGWIRVYREILDNPIWRDSTPEQCKILITLLSMASWKESDWDWLGKKKKLQPGQFVTSIKRIVNFAGRGVSEKNVRTALIRFQAFGFLTCVSTNKGRLITIVNWGKYQDIDCETGKQNGKQTAGNWQATGKQLAVNWQANNKEGKKVRREEGNNTSKEYGEKSVHHKYGEYENVLLTDEQFEKLKQEFPTDWKERVERLSFYIQSKGAKYKDHLATIRSWARKDKKAQTARRINQDDAWEGVTGL